MAIFQGLKLNLSFVVQFAVCKTDLPIHDLYIDSTIILHSHFMIISLIFYIFNLGK